MRTENDDVWPNELLTVQEIADYLRVSRVTVWRWCHEGTIPAFQAGRNWRIHRSDFLDFEANLRDGDDPPPPPPNSEGVQRDGDASTPASR